MEDATAASLLSPPLFCTQCIPHSCARSLRSSVRPCPHFDRAPPLSRLCLCCPRALLNRRAEDDDGEDEKERSERLELSRLLSPSPSSSVSSPSLTPSAAPAAPRSAHFSAYFSSSLHGTLSTDVVPLFSRLVFRTSRGNAILHHFPIDAPLIDPLTGASVRKSAFVLMYVGEEMEKRLKRCIAVVGGTEYDLPGGVRERTRLNLDLRERRAEAQRVLGRTLQELHEQLQSLAWDAASGSSPWWNWIVSLQRERGICETMRRCDQSDKSRMLLCEGWLQSDHLQELQVTLVHAVQQTQSQQAALQLLPVPPSLSPPTFFPTNKFTVAFQGIVDTYGVPRYKEANPGLFTLVSFPFLFGVMYGDIGHGALLTAAAVYLLLHERALLLQERRGAMNEILSMVFAGRYLMLMMGAFALYCGLVYNDCFSIPIPLFPSAHRFLVDKHGQSAVVKRGVYPFGVDWQWYGASNELAFFNSFKMKASVIIGVTQMTFGLLLSAANHRFFHDRAALLLEFVPRLLFLLCTFGYMCALILLKWTIDFSLPGAPPAANLIQTMINMFLAPGSVDESRKLFPGQAPLQALLLAVALLSVPVMLMGVPLMERREHARKQKEEEATMEDAEAPAAADSSLSLPIDDDDVAGHRRRKRHHGAAGRTKTKRGARLKGDYVTVDTDSDDGGHHGHDDDEKRPRDDGDEEKDGHTLGSSATAHPPHPHALLPLLVDKGLHQGAHPSASSAAAPVGAESAAGSTHAYSFSDALIAQSIHTIEFVLGCVSNTASYLRLWALSLAHAQLAGVFWQKMILQYGLLAAGEGSDPTATTVLMSVLAVAVWAGATFAVLLCMDVLECFLHALRLHWVESEPQQTQRISTAARQPLPLTPRASVCCAALCRVACCTSGSRISFSPPTATRSRHSRSRTVRQRAVESGELTEKSSRVREKREDARRRAAAIGIYELFEVRRRDCRIAFRPFIALVFPVATSALAHRRCLARPYKLFVARDMRAALY